jgi:alkylhydroperoxidase family enzyme
MSVRVALARQQGVTEELISEVKNYRESKILAPHEKAAIHFADVLAGDHLSGGKELFDELREHFSESEIIDLGVRMMAYVGYTRFLATMEVETFGGTCPLSDQPAEVPGSAAS